MSERKREQAAQRLATDDGLVWDDLPTSTQRDYRAEVDTFTLTSDELAHAAEDGSEDD